MKYQYQKFQLILLIIVVYHTYYVFHGRVTLFFANNSLRGSSPLEF